MGAPFGNRNAAGKRTGRTKNPYKVGSKKWASRIKNMSNRKKTPHIPDNKMSNKFMNKFLALFIFLVLVSGCSVSPQLFTTKTVSVPEGRTLDQLLVDSGVFNNNIYNNQRPFTKRSPTERNP